MEDLSTYNILALQLDARATHCLRNACIETIGQLTSKNDEEVLRMKNMGRKTLAHVKAKLANFGLALRGETPGGGGRQ